MKSYPRVIDHRCELDDRCAIARKAARMRQSLGAGPSLALVGANEPLGFCGALIAEPARSALIIMTICLSLCWALWRGPRRAAPGRSRAVALLCSFWAGFWFIHCRRVAGAVCGGLAMSRNEFFSHDLAAILERAAATYLMRVGGFWLMGHVPLTARMRRMLEALPGAVVAAIVLPLMVKTGSPAFLAIGATVAMMAIRRNEFLALAAGLTVAALARAGGL